MKFLVLLSVIAAAAALPLPDDCEIAVVPAGLPYAAAPVAHHLPYAAHVHAPAAHHLTYAAPVPVALPYADVKIPVTKTEIEIPVHQQVHYGTQSYVAGHTTSIHKPALAAPAIKPPSTLLSKITYNQPEVTVKHQEVPVERHTPKFVEQPYHAGTIVKYNAPEVKEIKVPTPYAQPVPVPHPVAVPHPVPVAAPVHSVAVAPAATQYTAVVAADDC